MKQLLLSFLLLFTSIAAFSQFTTPSINGSIVSNEYGTHTNGQNQQGNWYITWDATNLYIAIINTDVDRPAIFYIDKNPIVPVNGGANTDGSLVGNTYDNTNFSSLPFRADFMVYFKYGSREYRTANGSNGWGTATTSFGNYADNFDGLIGFSREISIPWSAMGGIPTSFNFLGYTTTASGTVANAIPAGNPSGSMGTSAVANYYNTVSNTANSVATKPFSQNSFATNATITLSNAQNLWDVTVNGSSITTTLSAMQSVSGAVAVASGNTLAAGGNLTLVSTATGTARIATISNAIGSITCNVTCQLYIPGGHRRFRFLGHPFNSNRNINILSGVDYTGAGGVTNGFTPSGTNNPSVFTFTTANANGGSPDGGWTAVTSANSGTPWVAGSGIRILVRGTPGQGLDGNSYTPSATTISMTGTLQTSAGFVTLDSFGTGSTARFNLIGNPFAAPVNIGQVRSSSGNAITKDIHLRNPQTGAYTTIDLDLNPNYAIPAYSAFFGVQNDPNTSLIFNLSRIVAASSGATVFSEAANKQQYFELQTLWNNEVYDNMYVKFDGKYNKTFNTSEDGGKPANDFINAYTLSSDNMRVANNCLPFEDGATIPLGITQNSGKRSLQFKISNYHLAANQQVTLVDKLTNTRTILEQDVTYNFDIDNADAASVGDNRFVLEMNSSKLQAIGETLPTATSFTAKLMGSNIIGNTDVQVQIANPLKAATSVRMINFLGQQVSTVQGSQAEQQSVRVATNSLQAGKYFIEVVCGNEKQMIGLIKN
jgi:hypothetical protein